VKAYWDSAALIESLENPELEERLIVERGFTRPHSLAEIFSALTGGGNLLIRVPASRAAQQIRVMAGRLDFVSLTTDEILKAFDQAERRGVRGGRIHDYLHALAAKSSGADVLLTVDKNDFERLVPGLVIEQV
jgi:hypothetical protein